MKLLAFLVSMTLLSAIPAPTPAPAEAIVLPGIVQAALVGGDVYMLHEDLSLTAASVKDIRLVTPIQVNSYGWPAVELVPGNPNCLTTSYKSTLGEHTVRTSCKGLSELRCAQKHKKQLSAMQQLFPKNC